MSGRGTPAIEAVTNAGVAFSVHEYERPERAGDTHRGRPQYGLEAASALDVDPARVFKTLIVEVDGRLVGAIVPVSAELDLKALAAAVGGRRGVMAEPSAAERATGYVIGGISPFGQRRKIGMVVDSSAQGHETVFVSGGRRGMQIELAPADLIRIAGTTVAEIARG